MTNDQNGNHIIKCTSEYYATELNKDKLKSGFVSNGIISVSLNSQIINLSAQLGFQLRRYYITSLLYWIPCIEILSDRDRIAMSLDFIHEQ